METCWHLRFENLTRDSTQNNRSLVLSLCSISNHPWEKKNSNRIFDRGPRNYFDRAMHWIVKLYFLPKQNNLRGNCREVRIYKVHLFTFVLFLRSWTFLVISDQYFFIWSWFDPEIFAESLRLKKCRLRHLIIDVTKNSMKSYLGFFIYKKLTRNFWIY